MTVYYEESNYQVGITGASLGETTKGAPQIEVGIRVLGYYDKACNGMYRDLTGPTRTVYLTLTEATMGTPTEPGWVYKTLVDLGFVGPSLADLSPLVGQVRDASCKIETYNDEQQEKWGLYRQRGADAQRPVAAPKVKTLDSQFGGLLKMAKAQGKPHETNGHARPSGRAGGQMGSLPTPFPPVNPAPQTGHATPPKPSPMRGPNGTVVDAPTPYVPLTNHEDIPF